MNVPVEQLTEAALALPSDARALLADRLAESLDPLADPEIRAVWAAESLRRLEELRSGTVRALSAEEVFARVRSGLK